MSTSLTLNNNFTTAVFLDLPSSAVNPALAYVPGLGYITSSMPVSASTPATQRIGREVVKETPLSRSLAEQDIGGGARLGRVTIFGSGGEPIDQLDMSTFDAFRSGKNIKNFKQFGGVARISPMIRISPEGFYEEFSNDKINHTTKFNLYGMGLHFKTVDEKYKFIPFKDFSKLNPTNLIGKEVGSGYPFIYTVRETYNQYLDPSHPASDGAIDVFEVRNSLANTSFSDIKVYGCRGQLQGGGIEESRKGSVVIDSKYEINRKSNGLFFDSQETGFSNFSFPKVGVTGSSGYSFPLPGFIDDRKYVPEPFNDAVDHLSGSYTFINIEMNDFLSSSRNRISEIGSRFKSTTSGLIFGESNVLGTDSIAFGGLKK